MHRVFLALVFACLAVASVSAQVAPSEGLDLVRAVVPTELPTDAERLPGEIARYHVDFAPQLVRAEVVRSGAHVRMALPSGEQTYRVTRVTPSDRGLLSIAGVAADGGDDVVAITLGPQAAAGVVTVGGQLYHLRWADGVATLVQVDPADLDHLECAIGDDEIEHDHFGLSPRSMREATAPLHMTSLGDGGPDDDPITIDILLAYTANADWWAGVNHGGIEAVIAQMMNLSQLALDNSDIPLVLRVVHTYETDYNENIPNIPGVNASSSHLRRFTAGPHYNPWGADAAGYMEEVHELRDQYGADLAALLAEVSGFGGVAWLLSNISGSPLFGFSVNRVQQMATGYTFVHEVGHNLGSHHSRNQTSAAAPVRGGIFAYSTGWRFDAPNDPQNNSYATVMTYTQAGSPRRPYFSNPNVSYQGVPTGAYLGQGAPADNARSIRETMRVVAAYRPTVVDPPVVGVNPGQLSVAVEPEATAVQLLEIANTGSSDLFWQLDIEGGTDGAAAAARASGSSDRDGIVVEQEVQIVGALGGNLSPSAVLDSGDLIYENTFSSSEGFAPGFHQHRGGWTARSDNGPFAISTSNASTGSQHLRLGDPPNSGNVVTVHSPFFGVWPVGGYEFSADISLNATGGPAYTLTLHDGRDGRVTAGLLYHVNGQIYVFNGFSASGAPTFNPSGRSYPVGQYETITIRLSPFEGSVDYLFDGEVALSRPFFGGKTFGQLQLNRTAQASANAMDIDNISLRMLYQGFEWLDADAYSGTTAPGATSVVTLNIDGGILPQGEHLARLLVQSNDPHEPVMEIPIHVTVGTIDTEPGATSPLVTQLLDSYPNPVRASGRIDYRLGVAADVTLEVFDVTGRRVAVLVDAFQQAGTHYAELDAGPLAGGMYIYRLTAGEVRDSGRLVVLK